MNDDNLALQQHAHDLESKFTGLANAKELGEEATTRSAPAMARLVNLEERLLPLETLKQAPAEPDDSTFTQTNQRVTTLVKPLHRLENFTTNPPEASNATEPLPQKPPAKTPRQSIDTRCYWSGSHGFGRKPRQLQIRPEQREHRRL